MYKAMLWVCFASFGWVTTALAQSTFSIAVNDTVLTFPVPSGYTVVTQNYDLDENFALFETTEIEQWEQAGEFGEFIVLFGSEYANKDEDVIAARFAGLFNSLYSFSVALREGSSFRLDTDLVSQNIFDAILGFSTANSAISFDVTVNDAQQKALLFASGYELIGVITYPILEEVSFVQAGEHLVVFSIQRVNFENRAAAELRSLSQQMRDDIIAAIEG